MSRSLLFDSHAHLDDEAFSKDREALIEAFDEQQVGLVLDIGADLASSQKALELAERYPFIYAAVGIHPQDINDTTEEDLKTLEKLAQNPKVRAIGEIGLDYHYDNLQKDRQHEWFIAQMRLANRLGLPFIVHSRDAAEDTYALVKSHKGDSGCVLHCFSQSAQMAKRYLELGCYLSFSGTVTFKNAVNIKEAAKVVPIERLLIETDCPYLAPVPHRGKRNEPAFVRYVAGEIAALKGLTVEEVMRVTWKNGCEFFGIEP